MEVIDLKVVKSVKVFLNYSYLLKQLVIRDFKIRYKRSVLGVLWSVLNPLFTMIILTLVFSNVFRLSDPSIINYPVYLLTGLLFFNYFSEATGIAIGSVVQNFSLITKVYMPKYIFPFSKVLSSALNFLFSLIALYAIILFFHIPITWLHILLPIDMIYIILFTLGVSLFISALAVFFRDIYYIYSVIVTAWLYLTPVMYTLKVVQDSKYAFFMIPIMKLNPLYHYVNYAREIILYHRLPTLRENLICLSCSLITLLIGTLFFRWKQDRFIYYI